MKKMESLKKSLFGDVLNDIEKAVNRKVGDMHPNGKWVWTETSPGKFDWRVAKKNKKGGDTTKVEVADKKVADTKQSNQQNTNQPDQAQTKPKSFEDMSASEIVDYAKNASTDALEKVVNDKKADKSLRQIAFNTLKKRDDYDKSKVDSTDLEGGHIPAPKPKIDYKTKKPSVEITVEDFKVPDKTGKIKSQSIAILRREYAKRTDDELLKTLNNRKANWHFRQVAYDEAAARGIPEDKIDVRGTLKIQWDEAKEKKDFEENLNKENDEEASIDLNWDLSFNHKEIMDKFFDGGLDKSWLDPGSKAVDKAFNMDSKSGRMKYDTFKDYYQRQPEFNPGYLNATAKVSALYGQIMDWIPADNSGMFISSGGAGAGKTYGFKAIAEYYNLQPFDSKTMSPDDDDWGYVQITDANLQTALDFRRILAKFNKPRRDNQGNEKPRILYLDDADKPLVSGQQEMKNLMKNICDLDPKNRVFKNPDTGQDEIWTGKIFMTSNKRLADLAKNSDFQAIQSRARINDIQFTRNETLELLADRDRFLKTELPSECTNAFKEQNYTEDEIEEFKQSIFDLMVKTMPEADPNKVTPRAYTAMAAAAAPGWKNGPKIVDTGKVKAGTNVPWRILAADLIKAMDNNDIEKSEGYYSNDEMMQRKKDYLAFEKKAKKEGIYDKFFSVEAQNAIIFGDVNSKDGNPADDDKTEKKKEQKKSKKIKKAVDYREMSLSEAESILLCK